MNKQDADRMIESYVRKLYGFAMSRLGNISEAEAYRQGVFTEKGPSL